jgi:U32 family peptidase
MKVLAPIRSFDEFEMLVESGAEELYCGIIPNEWLQRYGGAVWFNRRAPKGASLETVAELRRLVDAAHARHIPLFVTLNAPCYSADQLATALDCAQRLDDAGVDALIVSDVNLLNQLAGRKLSVALHVSSVAATLNSEAVRFLVALGAKRIVLPRSLTISEIRLLAAEVGDQVELEVFILNGGCAFEEGFCFTTHHHSVGGFCTSISKTNMVFQGKENPLSPARLERLHRNFSDYQEWIWYLSGNGCTVTPMGLPYGPCGLCAISCFCQMGIASLKIVGRETPASRKMFSVRMVADIVRQVRAQEPAVRVQERARSLRNAPEHCDSGYMCYYRS